jgi:hypothetical protein
MNNNGNNMVNMTNNNNNNTGSTKPKRSSGRARVAGMGLARGRPAATSANIGAPAQTPQSIPAVHATSMVHHPPLSTVIVSTAGPAPSSHPSSPPFNIPTSSSRPTTRGGVGSRARNRTPPPDEITDKMMTTTAPLSSLMGNGARSRPTTGAMNNNNNSNVPSNNGQPPQPTPPRSSHSRSAPIAALLSLPPTSHPNTIPIDDAFSSPDISPGRTSRPVTGSRAQQVRAMGKGVSHSQLPSPRSAAQALGNKRAAAAAATAHAHTNTTSNIPTRGRSKTPRRDSPPGSVIHHTTEESSRSPAPPNEGRPPNGVNRRASMGRLPSRKGRNDNNNNNNDTSNNNNNNNNGDDSIIYDDNGENIGAVTAPLSTALANNRRARTSAGRWRTRDREEKRVRAQAEKNQEESRQLFRDKLDREMLREEERLKSPEKKATPTTATAADGNNDVAEAQPRAIPPAVKSSVDVPTSLAALASALGSVPSTTSTIPSKPDQSEASSSASVMSPRRQPNLTTTTTSQRPPMPVAPVSSTAAPVPAAPLDSSMSAMPSSPFFSSPRVANVPRAFNADDFDDDDANAAVVMAAGVASGNGSSISVPSQQQQRRTMVTRTSSIASSIPPPGGGLDIKNEDNDSNTTDSREAAVAANLDALVDQRSLRGRVAAAAAGSRPGRVAADMYHPGQWRHHTNNEPYCWTCCYSRKKESMGCKRKPSGSSGSATGSGDEPSPAHAVRRSQSKGRI